jgi:diguanylate cyclase (GGDEF)-like protein
MRTAARITVATGGLLVAAAWVAGATGLVGGRTALTDAIVGLAAVFAVVLAWRYRRHRLAVAAVLVGATGLVLRSRLAAPLSDAGWAALALALAVDLGLLAVTRDRPLRRPASLIWLAAIAVQLGLTAAPDLAGDRLRGWLEHPALLPAALATAVVVTGLAFALRRGAFEAGLVWVAVALALALADRRGPAAASLLLAAALLVLLVSLVEDAYRLAFHDELTGLPGRRALDDATSDLGGDFCLAMVDIDQFKRFNDRHGHDAGDQVLRMVAAELAGVGAGGRAYRYGGEEFTIVFPGRAVAAVRPELERLRRAVAGRTFSLRGPDRPALRPEKPAHGGRAAQRLTVTVSIGVAGAGPRRRSAAAVLGAADRALYRAKRAGRNRLVAAGDRL